MNVSSNCQGRQPRWRRPALAAMFIMTLAGLVGAAQAVEFDERLKTPMMKNGAELRSEFESYQASAISLAAKSPLEAVRDRSASRQRFDAQWQLGRLVDAHTPLPELAALGFEAGKDGSYKIDTKQHPEWRDLDRELVTFSKPEILGGIASDLLARGFRSEDLDALNRYVREHDLERTQSARRLSLAISTSRVAKKYQKIRRPFDAQMMLSFVYQRSLDAAETQRQWANALLDTLDAQRQRVLASFLSEQAGFWSVSPTDDTAALEQERQMLLRADFEQLAKAAFEEGKL
jgi:hypothetical protein